MFTIWHFLAFFGVLITYYYNKNRRKYELAKQFDGPKTIPFFGNALLFKNVSTEELLKFTREYSIKYSKTFRIWIFNQLAIFTTDPKYVEAVLSSLKHMTKNSLYNMLVPWFGTGVLISTGEKWHNRRKIITPTFHFKMLEDFVEIFDKQSEILISKLRKQTNGIGFNIYPFITFCTLDIICESAMGTQIHSQTDEESEYAKSVANVLRIVALRFVKVWQRNDFLFKYFSSNKKIQDNSIKSIQKFTKTIIESRRQALENRINSGLIDEEEVDQFGRKRKMALLDVLLQATINGKPLSNEDILEEVDTFMFGGHDTSSSAISFILYCLSKHQDVQNKVLEEVQNVFGIGEDQEPITYKQLQYLEYTELVIKESMRLYPPVPFIGRCFQEDANICGKLIPAKSNFTIGIFQMMRDPEIFPKANEFIPERFSVDSKLGKINPYAYIPFSAGPRKCMGQKFSMLEMKTIISKIISNFEVLPADPEPILVMNIVLKSSNGIHIGLKPRNII